MKKPLVLKKYFEEQLTNIPNHYHQEVVKHLKEGDVILDAGCGSGEFGVLKIYGDPAGRIVGVDVSEEALKRNEVIDEHRVANLEEIPCEDNMFDLIVCETVCEHMENPKKIFSEFARVLKKGGFVVLRTYNVWNCNNAISASLPVGLRTRLKSRFISVPTEGTFPTYYRINSHRKMKSICDAAGLEEERFITYRDSPGYWSNRAIVTFFTLYEKLTDLKWLQFAKMHIVGVYYKR